ncbi:MAG: hypothetical protein QXR48_01780 [Candidatus Woesearchaeota archaeon]
MNWKFYFLLALVLVLCLTGCRQKEFVTISTGEQVPVKNETMPVAPAEPVPAPFEEIMNKTEKPVVNVTPMIKEEGIYERPPEEPPSIAKFLEQFRKEVKDYTFTYKSDKWLVKGKKAKIILFRTLQNQYTAPFIDTIYIDLEKRTAFGTCEGYNNNIKVQCAQRETLGKPYAVPYMQFKIQLPEDWLTDLQNLYFTVADAPRLAADRPTVHLKHQSQKRVIDIYIDPSSGLPVAVVDNGTEYHYQGLAKNQISPTEKMSAQ